MKLFNCQHCDLLLFFENQRCERCHHVLGYLPVENILSALEPQGDGKWQTLGLSGNLSKFCANAVYGSCNWLLPVSAIEELCIACRHNRTIPDLADNVNLTQWKKMEFAKHRLFYTLLRLQLPIPNRDDDAKRGLVFDFLKDEPDGKKVLTGHDDGLITIALKEADDVERTARRTAMHEPYRTLLGHFRHEIGHYYWDRLVADEHREDACRARFGDDREDYGDALKRHYDHGAPANWQEHFVSSYATSHPWEDFAETWAHYLHIIDSLDTASAYGIALNPTVASDEKLRVAVTLDVYNADSFEPLIAAWLPLTYAMNSMNRSMGLDDAYPFVLSPAVIDKLRFIHQLIHAPRQTVYASAQVA